jgi:hypothetical protein
MVEVESFEANLHHVRYDMVHTVYNNESVLPELRGMVCYDSDSPTKKWLLACEERILQTFGWGGGTVTKYVLRPRRMRPPKSGSS